MASVECGKMAKNLPFLAKKSPKNREKPKNRQLLQSCDNVQKYAD